MLLFLLVFILIAFSFLSPKKQSLRPFFTTVLTNQILFKMQFSSALFTMAFLTLANGAVLGKRSLSGEATFYVQPLGPLLSQNMILTSIQGGNVAGGACSFSTYTLPSNILGTALSDSNWDNSGSCGACVSVTGPSGNSILAMV